MFSEAINARNVKTCSIILSFYPVWSFSSDGIRSLSPYRGPLNSEGRSNGRTKYPWKGLYCLWRLKLCDPCQFIVIARETTNNANVLVPHIWYIIALWKRINWIKNIMLVLYESLLDMYSNIRHILFQYLINGQLH